MRQLALAYLSTQEADARSPLAGRVKVIVRQSLGTGPSSVSAVASVLAMSTRSLQRHLAAEGKSFAKILDNARRERADSLLTRSDLPLSQIAASIGLDSPATLSHYARRWWGTSARAYRQQGQVRPSD